MNNIYSKPLHSIRIKDLISEQLDRKLRIRLQAAPSQPPTLRDDDDSETRPVPIGAPPSVGRDDDNDNGARSDKPSSSQNKDDDPAVTTSAEEIRRELGSQTLDTDALCRFYRSVQQNGDVGPLSSWQCNNNGRGRRNACPENGWRGVVCTQGGSGTRVRELNLDDVGLSGGRIPRRFGDLDRLRFLRLQNNQLTGRIRTELGLITRLRVLNLAENNFDSSIPTELGDLTRLTTLDLHANQLTGRLPRDLRRLTSLNDLDISQNSLRGRLGRAFCDLDGTIIEAKDSGLDCYRSCSGSGPEVDGIDQC